MFDGLRKKLSAFVSGIAEKVGAPEQQPVAPQAQQPKAIEPEKEIISEQRARGEIAAPTAKAEERETEKAAAKIPIEAHQTATDSAPIEITIPTKPAKEEETPAKTEEAPTKTEATGAATAFGREPQPKITEQKPQATPREPQPKAPSKPAETELEITTAAKPELEISTTAKPELEISTAAKPELKITTASKPEPKIATAAKQEPGTGAIAKPAQNISQARPTEPQPRPPQAAEQTPQAQPSQFARQSSEWKPTEGKERELSPGLGIFAKIKSIITDRVEITDSETRGMFEELEMALLESDVSPDTAQALVAELRKRLVGRKVQRGEVNDAIKAEISGAITSVFIQPPDIIGEARKSAAQKQVYTIMFLGPNGVGKTTTIGKLAKMFKDNGLQSVVSASDTFRAAAIEQAGIHAERVGVDIVKQGYGADPAAVAFDAVKHAAATGAQVVLIDTAGRQETNRNLVEEMKKIDRVVKPSFKIFIGEAVAGHALVEQVKAFDAAVGVDGIILTKLDCDPKGGNAISIAHDAGKPIMFFGVGQEYGDLVPFDSGFVVRKVLEA